MIREFSERLRVARDVSAAGVDVSGALTRLRRAENARVGRKRRAA